MNGDANDHSNVVDDGCDDGDENETERRGDCWKNQDKGHQTQKQRKEKKWKREK